MLDERANIEGLRASIRVHLPAHLPTIGQRSVRLDLGERELNLFDLRRVVHLLKQEYGVEVTGLYVRAGVVHRFAERELKLKLFPNDPVAAAVPVAVPVANGRPPAQAAEVEELEELATEEVEELDEEPPPPAVLVPAPMPAAEPTAPPLAHVTLPHDLRPEDIGPVQPARPIAPSGGAERVNATPTRTHTLNRTLRSGTVVRFDGDVVVYGDVNPGAQIVASGNISVLGALKGVAHAGAEGDECAFVLAFDLRPTQIRIGAKIAVPSGRGQGPEIAVVFEDEIVVEPYKAGRRYNEPDVGRSTGSQPVVGAHAGTIDPLGARAFRARS
ncbi:MAG: septum site-determining protein MinC [Myxococcota bacterium]